jgi:tRNA threonylcarbamoyl adenosine modification protein (Sua5/YciO/YrdC/YwlC family)
MVKKMLRILKVNINHPEKEIIEEAVRIIKEGGLVAFPTETVYGLGVDALNEKGVRKIFEIKGRPLDKPLSIFISGKEELGQYVQEIPKITQLLIEKFWPGPLTLIFKASSLIPEIVKGRGSTIGVRMPNCKVAFDLVRASGVPLACPSANLSGRPSPTKAEEVIKELGEKIDLLLDGGETRIGVESTVLDLTTSPPSILREGALKREEIKEIMGKILKGKIVLFVCTGNSCRSPMAEALLKKMLEEEGREEIKVLSAGIRHGSFKNPTKEAIEAMKFFNLDISSHQTTPLSKELVEMADLILLMSEEHKRYILDMEPGAEEKVFLLKEFAGYQEDLNIRDPLGLPYSIYQRVAKEIREALKGALPRVLEYLGR